MLSVMQQQPPPTLPDLYTRPMSLAVLPSSPVTTLANQHDFPASSPSPSKRPKLSLDTSSVAPTAFGKKATSLRLETLSATSPTVRNTFSNAHEQKSSRLRLAPITTNLSSSPETATPSQINLPTPASPMRSIASSSSSTSSISTIDSSTQEVPYKLPFNHTSILKNGPIDRRSTQTTAFAQSKPMFPAPKKVGFKAPLTEDITTTKFTMRHSDLSEEGESSISTLDLNETKEGEALKDVKKVEEVKAEVPQTGEKRESSDEEEEEEENEMYPTTPVAGRRKRHRQWRWTLGPVGSEEEQLRSDESKVSEEKKEGS